MVGSLQQSNSQNAVNQDHEGATRVRADAIPQPHSLEEDLQQAQPAFDNVVEHESSGSNLQSLYLRQESLLAAIPNIIMEVDGNKAYTWVNRAELECSGDDVLGIDGVIAEARRICVF